jgi:hypothetical protein
MLVDDLIDSEPYSSVIEVERDHVVDKWLRFGMIFRGVESVNKHLLHHLEMGLWVERLIKWQEGSAEFKAVACKLHLFSCVNVLNHELVAGSLRGLHKPHEEVFTFSWLEVDAVVAWSLVAEVINHVLGYLSLNFGLFLGVGHDIDKVAHQMSESWIDSSWAKHEGPLSVLPLFNGWGLVLEGSELIFIYYFFRSWIFLLVDEFFKIFCLRVVTWWVGRFVRGKIWDLCAEDAALCLF